MARWDQESSLARCHLDRKTLLGSILDESTKNVSRGNTVLCIAISSSESKEIDDEDHLVPAQMGNAEFRHILSSKLAATPFDCGRVTILPSFRGESSISVYCQAANNKVGTCYVTCITADENLYQRTDGGQRPQAATAVKTKRTDAEFPRKTAETLREIWLRMLNSTRPHTSRRDWVNVPVDATSVEFSLERLGSQPAYGEIDIFSPVSGEKTEALVDLSKALFRYCKTASSDRPAAAAKIERSANQLLDRLKRQR